MKTPILLSLGLAALLTAGCKTTPPPLLTPGAVAGDVATLTRIGLDVYPQATLEVALSRDVICGAAAVTNVNPTAIFADLSSLNLTNVETKIIVNGAMWVYQQVYNAIGTNTTSQIQPYLQAVCDGLTQALPPTSSALVRVNVVPKALPPHLK